MKQNPVITIIKGLMKVGNKEVTAYFDTIVIGAGQAGLVMGHYLKQSDRSFILLERNQNPGDSWRKRYDSLILFTPRSYSALPGMVLPGNQKGFPSKNEIADYLGNYANKFEIPTQYNTKGITVQKIDGVFQVLADSGEIYQSRNIIIATGSFQKPFYPIFSDRVYYPKLEDLSIISYYLMMEQH